jgi:hypothetical protein
MKTVEVELDGRTFAVEELRSRANREWRGRLEGHFGDLAEALEGAGGLDVADGQALGGLVRTVMGKALGSVELITELVVAYAPQLAPVVDEAYDSEIVEAFVGVLGLAYPFGSVIGKLRALGDQLPQT